MRHSVAAVATDLAGAVAIGDAGHGEDDCFPGMLVLTVRYRREAVEAWLEQQADKR
jgi:hypothetical protein